jgi:hypothetical protein
MLTVAWDIDDVLNELMQAWFSEAWLPSHPDCNLSYSDITENPPDRVLGITRVEYLASLDTFRVSAGAANLKPIPEVLQWFAEFGAEYRHIAITVRPLDSVSHAAEWVFRHFGNYIRSFAVVPSRPPAGVPIYDRSKAEFLEWLGKADILVDDSDENIRAAEKLGMRGILFPQPWNRSSLTVRQALESVAMPLRSKPSFTSHGTETV